MPATIRAPRFSFIQFAPPMDAAFGGEAEFYLPVQDDSDIAFQFFIDTETVNEADELMSLGQNKVRVGLADSAEAALYTFPVMPKKYRINEKRVLCLWTHGLPSFKNYVALGKCFCIFVRLDLSGGTVKEHSMLLQRIADDVYTSVLEYGSDANAYGFNYCGTPDATDVPDGEDPDTEVPDGTPSCSATIFSFTNKTLLAYTFTADMRTKYGDVPTVEVWTWNGTRFERPYISVELDGVPTTTITVNLGGVSSGYVKIY